MIRAGEGGSALDAAVDAAVDAALDAAGRALSGLLRRATRAQAWHEASSTRIRKLRGRKGHARQTRARLASIARPYAPDHRVCIGEVRSRRAPFGHRPQAQRMHVPQRCACGGAGEVLAQLSLCGCAAYSVAEAELEPQLDLEPQLEPQLELCLWAHQPGSTSRLARRAAGQDATGPRRTACGTVICVGTCGFRGIRAASYCEITILLQRARERRGERDGREVTRD